MGRSQKASPEVTPSKPDQAPAVVETQAFTSAVPLEAIKKQTPGNIISKEVDAAVKLPDKRSTCSSDAGPQGAADACNTRLPQQPKFADPKPAVCVMAAHSASQGFSALQSLADQALQIPTAIEVSAARPSSADLSSFIQSAGLTRVPQQPRLPADTCECAPQPAKPRATEPLQVCLLI